MSNNATTDIVHAEFEWTKLLRRCQYDARFILTTWLIIRKLLKKINFYETAQRNIKKRRKVNRVFTIFLSNEYI